MSLSDVNNPNDNMNTGDGTADGGSVPLSPPPSPVTDTLLATLDASSNSLAEDSKSPFGRGRGEGLDLGRDEEEWVVDQHRSDWDATFSRIAPANGKLTGATAKQEMVKSKLPNTVLGKIWKLADIDADGMLDKEEFALAQYLIKMKLDGYDVPSSLPDHLIPPGKRDIVHKTTGIYPSAD